MKMKHFSQPLQISLDDTQGWASMGRFTFEELLGNDLVGMLTWKGQDPNKGYMIVQHDAAFSPDLS
jgi:hypothetical protein